MPDFLVRILVDPSDARSGSREAKTAIDTVGASVVSLNQALELVQKGFALLRSAVELPVRQFQALFAISSDLVRTFDVQILAQTKLATVLKASGQGAEEQVLALTKLASSLQEVTRFGDEAIISGQALSIGLGVPIEQMGRFSKAAVDLAAFLGKDVVQGFRMLNIAIQTGSIPRLKQNITDATDPAERFNDVLNFVTKSIGGLAEATAKVGAGPLDQLANVFGDFRESLGAVVAQAPQFQQFIANTKEALKELIAFVDANRDRLATVFGNLFVASLNLAKAALIAFVDVTKAAFTGLLDLFLQVADSPIGSFLNLDEGIGDLANYREQLRRVDEQTKALAETEQRLGERIEQRMSIALNPEFDNAPEWGQLIDEYIEQERIEADRIRAALEESRTELASSRNAALGLNPDGFFSPALAALTQFNALVEEGAEPLQNMVDIVSRPLHPAPGSLLDIDGIPDGGGLPPRGSTVPDDPSIFSPDHTAGFDRVNGGGEGSITDQAKQEIDETTTIYNEFAKTVPTTADAVIGSVHAMASALGDSIVDVLNGTAVSVADLARSILIDIERIVIQMLLLRAAQAALGVVPAANAPIPVGRASGGPVLPGHSYLVGEDGPELVQFSRAGNVTPAKETAAAMRQNVTVRVVDVRSPDDLAAALSSGKYDNEVVAVLRRNPGAIASFV